MAGKIELQARLPVIFFQELDKIIAYSPALNLTTFGKTEDQARKRFIEAAMIFLEELARMGTIDEVLEENGWRKLPEGWTPPVYKKCTEELIQIPAGVV